MTLGLFLVLAGLLLGAPSARHRTAMAAAPSDARRALAQSLTVGSLILVCIGCLLIARVSLLAELAVVLGIGGLWTLGEFLRDDRAARRVMTRAHARFRRAYPREPEVTRLVRTLHSRHPGWTNEQLVSLVLAYPTLGALIRAVIGREKLGISPEEMVGLHRFVADVLRETGAGPGQFGPQVPHA